MDNISTTPNPQPLYSGASTPAESPAKPPALSSDFETFLKMLTVQMQNQDPLNPVESQDFAVQLATFSTVEQQVQTNDLLRDMNGQIGGGAVGQLASWIGMEALARAPVRFDGVPVALRPAFDETADAAQLLVRDSSGEVVQKLPMNLGEEQVSWAGMDPAGTPFPSGTYRFEVESYRQGTLIDTTIAATYNRVEEARLDGSDVMLRLSDGSEIVSTMVTGLRAPTP